MFLLHQDVRRYVHAQIQSINWGGGGCTFIYSGLARLIPLKSTLFRRAEPENMNIHPPPPPPTINALDPSIKVGDNKSFIVNRIVCK